MKTREPNPHRRLKSRAAVVGGLLALTLSLTSPVLAGHGGPKHHPRHHHPGPVAHGHHVRPVPPPPVRVRTVVVPTVIGRAQATTYRPYYRGQVYYAPHGHVHTVYSFPVWPDRVPAYETRYYCRGGLFVDGRASFVGPGFSLQIAF